MPHNTVTKLAAAALAFGAIALSGFHTPAHAAAPKFDAKGFFAANCAACHGAKGQGGMGPNLTKVEAKGDAFITNRIKKGSPKGMPPFESRLKPNELKALIAYVKGL